MKETLLSNKYITDLVPDILQMMEGEVVLNEENVKKFSSSLSTMLAERLTRSDFKPALRASNIGKACNRQLWYSINMADKAAPLPARARLNFLYGDILEELLLFLAAEAGHRVEGQQDRIEIDGVGGRRDAVIDGVTVEIKSANGRSFFNYTRGLSPSDPFQTQVIKQLGFYIEGGADDPLVTEKKYGAFIAFNKEKGELHLGLQKRDNTDWPSYIAQKKEMLAKDYPPPRGFIPVPDGKSGNMKLQTVCGYCAHKDICYPEHRTFLYSGTPRHLTKVVRVPDVPELHR